jgi:hypothetical protein
MKRYAAYDPPEYQSWTPEPSVMAEFRARVSQNVVGLTREFNKLHGVFVVNTLGWV